MKHYRVHYLERISEIIIAQSLKDAENQARLKKNERQTILEIEPYEPSSTQAQTITRQI